VEFVGVIEEFPCTRNIL